MPAASEHSAGSTEIEAASTGWSLEHLALVAADLGAWNWDDGEVLPKPYTPEGLLATIEALLARE